MNARDVIGSLCCECGNLKRGIFGGRNVANTAYELYDPEYARERLRDAEASMAEHPSRLTTQRYHEVWKNEVDHEYENRTCDLKCPVCGKVTRHATVLSAEAPDWAEVYNMRGGPLPSTRNGGDSWSPP